MQVAVMGAGAIGCFHGGHLARAGHTVTLIGRPVHVAAIRANGLLFETKDFKGYVPASASEDAAAVAGADLVLVAVKSADTEAAGRAMASSLAPGARVVSLQNGVDNASRLAAVLGRAVIPAVVYVGTEMAGPGHVRQHGPGDLLIGASPGSDEIAAVLTAAGLPATVSPDIAQAQWLKLVTNCVYNPLSAVAQVAYGPMMGMPGTRELVADVLAECTAVACALGVTLPADLMVRVMGVAARMPAQKSSTAQDLARGKITEIDYLNGYVVREGTRLGIPTPANRALQVMVKLAELGVGAARPA